jgi:CheY-like chemotaxis protein
MILAEADAPELAVVDLRLPGKSGLELIEALRAVDSATAIVVLTGYGSIATAVESVKLAATSYLTKPVDADQVVGVVAEEVGKMTGAFPFANERPDLFNETWSGLFQPGGGPKGSRPRSSSAGTRNGSRRSVMRLRGLEMPCRAERANGDCALRGTPMDFGRDHGTTQFNARSCALLLTARCRRVSRFADAPRAGRRRVDGCIHGIPQAAGAPAPSRRLSDKWPSASSARCRTLGVSTASVSATLTRRSRERA